MNLKKEKVSLDELMLIGVTARTNNKDEMDPDKAKIGKMVHDYGANHIANGFKHRVHPGMVYAVYTDFESDENGEYTYFLGEAVTSFDDQDQSTFTPLVIPASTYQCFTTEAGKMPDIVIEAWQNIWQMTPEDFGGKRTYQADFEIYDQRAADPNHAVVPIYIGIE